MHGVLGPRVAVADDRADRGQRGRSALRRVAGRTDERCSCGGSSRRSSSTSALCTWLFNAAVVFEFGRRIERGAGSWCCSLLTLLIAVVSNVAQFLATRAPLFGGLSGVAYGLFAYVAVRGRLDRAPIWQVNPSFSIGVRGHAGADDAAASPKYSVCTLPTPCIGSALASGIAAAAMWRPARETVAWQLTIVEPLGSGVLRGACAAHRRAGRYALQLGG